LDAQYIYLKEVQALWQTYEDQAKRISDEVRKEASPSSSTIWDHTFVNNENANWRNF
jgi:2-oxoisovalerate dehydrogenase E1 component alpha subunit